MACLALSLQSVHGSDLLLQTTQWFPPVRAAAAATSFKEKRLLYNTPGGEGLGDDALATSSGQVVVGMDGKYRVVYRLVNTIYVLGITSADQDDASNNVFDCTNTVNRAVYVLVAACRGTEVTSEKVLRKYTDVYLALNAVLHGATSAKLALIISTVAGTVDSATQGGVLAALTEPKSPQPRGKESNWNEVKQQTLARQACIEVLAKTTFELPPECVVAGDEAAAALAPPPQQSATTAQTTPTAPRGGDPFAASGSVEDDEFGAVFGKRHYRRRDSMAALVELEGGQVGGGRGGDGGLMGPDGFGMGEGFTGGLGGLEEGFEGDYGNVDFGDADDAFGGGFGDAFDNSGDAFGGGFDASEFGASIDVESDDIVGRGLGGLSDLVIGSGARAAEAAGAPTKSSSDPFGNPSLGFANRGDSMDGFENGFDTTGFPPPIAGADQGTTDDAGDVSGPATRAVTMWVEELVHAEFRGMELVRVGLQGEIHIRPPPPSMMGGADSELSFRLEGTAGVKRAVLNSALASSVGQGVFYVRVPPSEKPSCLLKYRLLPRFTPLPLRIRLVTKVADDAVAWMIQYVANPYLFSELTNVKFSVVLPFTVNTQFLKMTPSGIWNSKTKELQWNVNAIVPGAKPERLRARLEDITTAMADDVVKKLEHLQARVEFEWVGQNTLSGVSVRPASEGGTAGFHLGKNKIKTGNFICS